MNFFSPECFILYLISESHQNNVWDNRFPFWLCAMKGRTTEEEWKVTEQSRATLNIFISLISELEWKFSTVTNILERLSESNRFIFYIISQ